VGLDVWRGTFEKTARFEWMLGCLDEIVDVKMELKLTVLKRGIYTQRDWGSGWGKDIGSAFFDYFDQSYPLPPRNGPSLSPPFDSSQRTIRLWDILYRLPGSVGKSHAMFCPAEWPAPSFLTTASLLVG
jgi:hypothetical protein